jgi:hypothetical protein
MGMTVSAEFLPRDPVFPNGYDADHLVVSTIRLYPEVTGQAGDVSVIEGKAPGPAKLPRVPTVNVGGVVVAFCEGTFPGMTDAAGVVDGVFVKEYFTPYGFYCVTTTPGARFHGVGIGSTEKVHTHWI